MSRVSPVWSTESWGNIPLGDSLEETGQEVVKDKGFQGVV